MDPEKVSDRSKSKRKIVRATIENANNASVFDLKMIFFDAKSSVCWILRNNT